MQKPSVGRIVHYVEKDGSHKPGIIHTVHSDTCVSLNVFGWTGVSCPSSVCLDPGADANDGKGIQHRPGTWHWPESVSF